MKSDIFQYSGKEIDNLESDIDQLVLDLLNLIEREYSGKVMDFARLAQYFTLDVLSKIAFGSAFGYITANEDLYDYNKTTAEFMPILEMITNHPSIRSIMASRPVQALAAPKGTDTIGQGRILGIAQAAVAERFGPDAKVKRDMLGSFISRGLTQQEAESESHLQIMAGSESTSGAMRVTFMYIIANPVAYSKLLAEIEAAIDRGAISYPIVKHTEALQLPYLQACIWEGLRICPPLFGLQSKLAPPQGETVNGTFYPPGTEIATCPSMVTRRKDIFGNDADIFRPERWLEADPSTRAKYERTTDVIFGSGRFVCLGKSIAWMELNKAFVEASTPDGLPSLS
jgi:cytochrome P450